MASLPCWCCQHAEFEKQFGIKIPHPFPSPQGGGWLNSQRSLCFRTPRNDKAQSPRGGRLCWEKKAICFVLAQPKITVAILSDKLGQCGKWKTKLSEGSPKLPGDPSLKAGW